jgi:hypothetical protein
MPKITKIAGHPMAYFAFLPILRKEDGSIIDTLSQPTRLYTAVGGKIETGDGCYLPETPESVATMWEQAMSFPEPVALYMRGTRRLAWTLVGTDPDD